MKIGNFVIPNTKGQIVIPKKLRDELKITTHTPLHMSIQGQAIAISPVRDIITNEHTETSYYHLLKKTQGSWIGEDKSGLVSEDERRRKELEATERNKNAW